MRGLALALLLLSGGAWAQDDNSGDSGGSGGNPQTGTPCDSDPNTLVTAFTLDDACLGAPIDVVAYTPTQNPVPGIIAAFSAGGNVVSNAASIQNPSASPWAGPACSAAQNLGIAVWTVDMHTTSLVDPYNTTDPRLLIQSQLQQIGWTTNCVAASANVVHLSNPNAIGPFLGAIGCSAGGGHLNFIGPNKLYWGRAVTSAGVDLTGPHLYHQESNGKSLVPEIDWAYGPALDQTYWNFVALGDSAASNAFTLKVDAQGNPGGPIASGYAQSPNWAKMQIWNSDADPLIIPQKQGQPFTQVVNAAAGPGTATFTNWSGLGHCLGDMMYQGIALGLDWLSAETMDGSLHTIDNMVVTQ